VEALGSATTGRYRDSLLARGIAVAGEGLGRALRSARYDVVLFEWYFPATDLIEWVRANQRGARIIIDSVDVVFNRLDAKARLTRSDDDASRAAATRATELATYEKADIVLTVTDADAAVLLSHDPSLAIVTIPNIHPLAPPLSAAVAGRKQLIFVGSFAHEPNVDAMVYFCREVFPRILVVEPDARLCIIGSWPPREIAELASERVEVPGFVPDIEPHLAASAISIAPIRFGSGMKGKIGEAMSRALPVVSTSVGIEGFGLEPGRDVLIGDTPEAFANAVIELLGDDERRDRIRWAGYEFIRANYSDHAAKVRLRRLLATLDTYPIRRQPPGAFLGSRLKTLWERHAAWRFRRDAVDPQIAGPPDHSR
jgi:glycosyltransferase involved in cell wall biosynthesis